MTPKEWVERVRLALQGRAHQYRTVFRSPPGEVVLKDLARFCRAHESTFHENERVQSKMDGRREVWLRIEHHLHLPPEELWNLYSGRREE